jgi:RNA polymerase sigma-70 factor (ECF subfamily)
MNSDDQPAGLESESATHVLRVQQLFVASQGNLLAFILSLHPGLAEAEDILQETFLVISRKADTFAVGSNFLAWACTIARFKVLEFRRRQNQHAARISDAAIESLCAELPEDGFFDSRLGALRDCLHKLAPRAREMIWLRYQGAREPEEIAQQVQWTPGAVRVALTRARGALRACVELKLKEAAR